MKHVAMIFLVVCSTAQAQSPWVAEKGKGFFQLGYTTIGPYSDLFLKDGGSYALTREVTDATIQAYGEYGLGSKTSILGAIPLKSLKTGELLNPSVLPNASGSFTTLGNIQVAARHNFVTKKIVFSGQMMLELPTAGYDDPTGLRGGLDALSIVPSVSAGFGTSSIYGYLSTGVAIRNNDYSSDWRLGGELGYKVLNRVYVIGVIDIVQNFENGNAIESANQLQTGLYLNNQSFFAYGLKTIIGFTEHIGISGAFYGAGSGHVVAKSPSINFGVYYKL